MKHKVTILTVAIIAAATSAFFAPIIPILHVVTPSPCGLGVCTGGVCSSAPVCHGSSLYLVSSTHYFLGFGGYFWAIWQTNSSEWHFGFDF